MAAIVWGPLRMFMLLPERRAHEKTLLNTDPQSHDFLGRLHGQCAPAALLLEPKMRLGPKKKPSQEKTISVASETVAPSIASPFLRPSFFSSFSSSGQSTSHRCCESKHPLAGSPLSSFGRIDPDYDAYPLSFCQLHLKAPELGDVLIVHTNEGCGTELSLALKHT